MFLGRTYYTLRVYDPSLSKGKIKRKMVSWRLVSTFPLETQRLKGANNHLTLIVRLRNVFWTDLTLLAEIVHTSSWTWAVATF